MREGLIREIASEYEAQRAQNHAEEARRRAEAAEKDSQIGHLIGERARLFQNGAREALASPERAQEISEWLTARIAEIQTELRNRLRMAGLPADYLQPVYRCTTCHDTGYVGELVRERCSCFDRRLRETAAKTGGQGLNIIETFGTYNEAVYSDTPLEHDANDTQRRFMARMRVFCEGYASAYPHNEKRNLLLFGMSGLGKTYLLNCIGNHIHDKGYEVMKITAYQMTERMREALFDRSPEAFSVLLQVPLLLLDDLGAEPLFNNITVEQLFTLLNERQLAGLHTIISTNLMPDELKQRYTERVISRLMDRRTTSLLQFKGTDVRLREA